MSVSIKSIKALTVASFGSIQLDDDTGTLLDVIPGLQFNPRFTNHYVTVLVKTATTFTLIGNIELWGTLDGVTYVKVADFAGVTSATSKATSVDINAYPCAGYKLRVPTSATDSNVDPVSTTLDVTVIY